MNITLTQPCSAGNKVSSFTYSSVLIDEQGGEVLLWLESTQRNAMDDQSRVNSAHSAPGEKTPAEVSPAIVLGWL